MKRDNLTVRQPHNGLADSPDCRWSARLPPYDSMEEWLKRACDGFNVMFQFTGQARRFRRPCRARLQRRGLFRKECEGTTLREHRACLVRQTASSRLTSYAPERACWIPRKTVDVLLVFLHNNVSAADSVEISLARRLLGRLG
jgi:hypothetical protein